MAWPPWVILTIGETLKEKLPLCDSWQHVADLDACQTMVQLTLGS